jgi:rhodanese-related sulfurtransferase
MKKLVGLLLTIAAVFTLAACQPETVVEVVEKEVIKEVYIEAEEVEIPAEVTMANIDTLLERDNVQLVDLRNWNDKVTSGYIAGFEMISFFEVLEGYAIQRTDGWNWVEANMVDEDILANFFDKDADAIFLMCGSGTRAGFVKSALEQIGYTNVYNAGGIKDYAGDFKVDGLGSDYVGKVLPGTVTMANVDAVLEADNVQLIDLRQFNDKIVSGYIAGFEMIPFFEVLEAGNFLVRTDGDWTFAAEDIVDADVLENYFDRDARAIYLMCGSGTRAGFVKAALEELGYTNVVNAGGIKDYAGENKVEGLGDLFVPAA